jgi:hypothetical protein
MRSIVDTSVYTNFRLFRMLGNCKIGKPFPLQPCRGSSASTADHLVSASPEALAARSSCCEALPPLDLGRRWLCAPSLPMDGGISASRSRGAAVAHLPALPSAPTRAPVFHCQPAHLGHVQRCITGSPDVRGWLR